MGIDADETSTSTSTGAASIPIKVYDESFASIPIHSPRDSQCRTHRGHFASKHSTPVYQDEGAGILPSPD